jgi:hypothetical protein
MEVEPPPELRSFASLGNSAGGELAVAGKGILGYKYNVIINEGFLK